MSSRRAASASEAVVAEAARDRLAAGNAVDAVVAGVLVAAAEWPSVFLGPLQVLAAGPGAGLRAIDGRVRQPGRRVPRPRGLLADEAVPPSAWIGVPALPAAIALAMAVLGSTSASRVAGPAIERAKVRSPERARVLEAFARLGASALLQDAIVGELTSVAGRSARGLLTREDVASVRPAVESCDDRTIAASGIWTAPWRDRGDGSWTQVVAATDDRGLVAIACYEAPPEGLDIPALGLLAPAFASPVRRGQPRVRPGRPCAAAAPIAVRVLRGVADLAFGLGQTYDAEAGLDAAIVALGEGATIAAALAVATAEGRPVVVAREGAEARVISSA